MADDSRRAYSEQENRAMLRFAAEQLRQRNSCAWEPKGNELWELAAERKITEHSAQSMRDHFRRHLYKKASKTSSLNDEDRKLCKDCWGLGEGGKRSNILPKKRKLSNCQSEEESNRNDVEFLLQNDRNKTDKKNAKEREKIGTRSSSNEAKTFPTSDLHAKKISNGIEENESDAVFCSTSAYDSNLINFNENINQAESQADEEKLSPKKFRNLIERVRNLEEKTRQQEAKKLETETKLQQLEAKLKELESQQPMPGRPGRPEMFPHIDGSVEIKFMPPISDAPYDELEMTLEKQLISQHSWQLGWVERGAWTCVKKIVVERNEISSVTLPASYFTDSGMWAYDIVEIWRARVVAVRRRLPNDGDAIRGDSSECSEEFEWSKTKLQELQDLFAGLQSKGLQSCYEFLVSRDYRSIQALKCFVPSRHESLDKKLDSLWAQDRIFWFKNGRQFAFQRLIEETFGPFRRGSDEFLPV